MHLLSREQPNEHKNKVLSNFDFEIQLANRLLLLSCDSNDVSDMLQTAFNWTENPHPINNTIYTQWPLY